MKSVKKQVSGQAQMRVRSLVLWGVYDPGMAHTCYQICDQVTYPIRNQIRSGVRTKVN